MRKHDIYLDAEGNRIWMAAHFRDDFPARIEGIPGSGFAKDKRYIRWAQQTLKIAYPPKGIWTFPLNFRTCLDIRREFDDCEIHIGPKLWAWAAEEKARRDDLLEIMAAEDWPTPRLDVEAPLLSKAVHARPFQAVGIAYMVRAGCAINADQPGLGKTLQAIGAIIEGGVTGPVLVIAPSVAVTATWPDEFDAWVPDEEYAVCEGDRPWREKVLDDFWVWAASRPGKRSWLFVNSEMLQTELPPQKRRQPKAMPLWQWLGYQEDDELDEAEAIPALPGSPAAIADEEFAAARAEWDPDQRRYPSLFENAWSAVIVDEGQRILPTKSGSAKGQSKQRSGAQKLIRAGGPLYDLTGTPMKGNPLNLWGALNWMLPDQYSGFWTYVDRWFDVYEDPDIAGRIVEGIRPEVEADYGAELNSFMIRRTKAEVAPWLPAKVYGGTPLTPGDSASPVGVWVDMTGKQRTAYDSMIADAVAMLDNGQLMAQGLLAEMTRCRQMAGSFGDVEHVLRKRAGEDYKEWVDRYSPKLPSNKWDWVVEFLEERGILNPKQAWGDGKVIIASWQTGLLNLMRAEATRLKIPSLIITGQTNDRDRRNAKSTFQAPGGPRLFFLNTYAGGVSLTLDAADDMVVLDETWVPDDQEQLEDRIHRISRGGERPPATYWYVRSRGTIEEHIAKTTLGKDLIQKRLMDGRRGVDLARQLLIGG